MSWLVGISDWLNNRYNGLSVLNKTIGQLPVVKPVGWNSLSLNEAVASYRWTVDPQTHLGWRLSPCVKEKGES